MKDAPAADQVVAEIERTLQTLRDHADTDELKRLRRLLRKKVPLFLRSYFYAFLLQRLLGSAPSPVAAGGWSKRAHSGRGSRGGGAGRSGREGGSDGTAAAQPEGSAPPSPAPASDDSLRRLFISIGRNRRVQAQDLTSLIGDTVSIDEDRFGRIKILDNYSFVEVPGEVAQQIIDQLSGSSFKGRKITVDFARSRG